MTDKFKVMVVGDTQFYSREPDWTKHFIGAAQYAVDNYESDNIVFFSQAGDVIDRYVTPIPDQWVRAQSGIDILETVASDLPQSFVPGNHDADDGWSFYPASGGHWLDYRAACGADRHSDQDWYGGSYSNTGTEIGEIAGASGYDEINHYEFFTANGRTFLHMGLQYEVCNPVFGATARYVRQWASGVLDTYSDIPTIITTHNAWMSSSDPTFQELGFDHPQIFMILSGHSFTNTHTTVVNASGTECFLIQTNYQGLAVAGYGVQNPDYAGSGQGGAGFFKLFEFDEDNSTIDVTTISNTFESGIEYFEGASIGTDPTFSLPISGSFDERFGVAEPDPPITVDPDATQLWDAKSFVGWGAMSVENWGELIAENCHPVSIFGPINHTLFLGCSVVSFSASVGWNEQQGQCTITVVEDTCTSATGKLYWDSDLQIRMHYGADPGFLGENDYDIIGSPAYFRVDNFEYTGIIQSWEKSYASNGNPLYTITMVDPRQILQGAQLIIGEYAGGVSKVYNLFNVYGYMESLGGGCGEIGLGNSDPPVYSSSLGVDGAMFGSEAGGFGGANANNNGMQWNYIAGGINALCNGGVLASSAFSPYGRLNFKATDHAGYGLLAGDRLDLRYFDSLDTNKHLAEYFLDISEVPYAPSYWRLQGSNVSILEAISSVCADAGYDYYLELIPVRHQSAIADSGIAKFIKVRTVRRLLQPVLGQIDAFIADGQGTASAMVGNELRNEPTTSFVIGGKKNTYYQIEATDVDAGDVAEDTIIPYFGLDPATKDVIIPTRKENDDGDRRWEFITNTLALQQTMQVLNVPLEPITITELELLAALSGFDSWITFAVEAETATGLMMIAEGVGPMWDIKAIVKFMNALVPPAARDAQAWVNNPLVSVEIDDARSNLQEDLDALFAWVNKFATEYYGKKYQILVPYTCLRLDDESGNVLTNESPSQTGWTDRDSILHMPNSSPIRAFMSDEDGRVEAMVRFDDASNLDTTALSENDFGYLDDEYFVRCTVENDYVYGNYKDRLDPRAVLTLPGSVSVKFDMDLFRGVALLVKLLQLKLPVGQWAAAWDKVVDMLTNVGGKQVYMPLVPQAIGPNAAGFGIQSNVLTYGPWAVAGPAGTVRVEHDGGLVPWEFGGMTTMNLAGNSKATAGITYMQVGEKGNINIPGYPTLPLGAELGAYNGGFYGAGTNLVENRDVLDTDGTYSTTIGGWTGLYGPNVTDINVSVTEGGASTTYSMRTYTPKFGRFLQGNAESLKSIGQNRLKGIRQILIDNLGIQTRTNRKRWAAENRRILNNAERPQGKVVDDKASPHEVLVGQMIPEFREGEPRTLIATYETKEIATVVKNYGTTAYMGWEGLIRPISMDGDGGLPQYINYSNIGCNTNSPNMSHGAQPPVSDDPTFTNTYYDEPIDQDYLNPVSNPASRPRSALSAKASGNYSGHDFDIIGRGSGMPEGLTGSGLPLQSVGYEETDKGDYEDDYRFFGIRGPIMMQSWGYDIDGRPVPNYKDNEADASGGIFKTDELSCYFLDDHMKKPHTWPVAPIDFRLDRQRGLWVSPQPYKLVRATLLEDMCGNLDPTPAIVTDGQTLYDCNGNTMAGKYIMVQSACGQCLPIDSEVICYWDTYSCTYFVIEGPGNYASYMNCGIDFENRVGLGPWSELVAGTGIGVALSDCGDGTGCVLLLQSNIFISDIGGCCSGDEALETSTGSWGSTPRRYETLIFGSGIIVDEVEGYPCTAVVSICCSGGSSSGSGIIFDMGDDSCVGLLGGTQVSDDKYQTIKIEKGLDAVEDLTDSDVVHIGLSFTVGDVEEAASISLGDCLQAVSGEGGCDAVLSFASSIVPEDGGTKLWYVSHVECSGDDLIVEKKWIDITDCGTVNASGDE